MAQPVPEERPSAALDFELEMVRAAFSFSPHCRTTPLLPRHALFFGIDRTKFCRRQVVKDDG